MITEIITILILVIAIFIAKYNLVYGAILAMFPTKLIGFALVAPGNLQEISWALFKGATATFLCSLCFLIFSYNNFSLWYSLLISLCVWLITVYYMKGF